MARIALPAAAPSKDQFDYGGKKLAEKHVELISETFTDAAIRLAQHMGCLDPAAQFSAAAPARGQTIVGDGKVLKTPLREAAAEQRKLKGLPVPAEWSLHAQGGSKHLVYGSKFEFWNVRPGNTRNEQVILNCTPCGKNEAAVAVRTARSIIEKTRGGTHAVGYDGAFRGVHIEELQSAGPQVFCPVSKNVKPRHHELVRCKCGTTHDIWLAEGAPHEREILDTGEVHLVPCPTETPDRRPNKNGRFRWYVNMVLSCGNKRSMPAHLVQRDIVTRFNRQENLRLSTRSPEGTSAYDRSYGRRSNAESINRLIQNGLANRQVAGYSINKQWLLLLGLGIARNALAWHLWQRSQAPPGKTI